MADPFPHPAQSESEPRPVLVEITGTDELRAVLTFRGVLDAHSLPELEELLGDRRLRQAVAWSWDMRHLERIDLACAYALLRAVTRAPETVRVTAQGVRHAVHRTLRHAGLDSVVTIEE